jgi:hypothetical protein
MNNYDLIIVGAGPSGLALAQCASTIGKKVLLLDKENSIGGCHRVYRFKTKQTGNQMLFSEHGPRIYSSTYKNFKMLLNKMGIDFNDLFTIYNFSFTVINNFSIKKMHSFELYYFFIEFMKLTVNRNHGLKVSVKSFCESHNFTIDTMDYLDALCRLTDGATIDKYSINQLLMIVNQQALYDLYQPKQPTDIGLFKVWYDYLSNNNVDIQLNTLVKTIEYNNDSIVSLNGNLTATNYVFAIPLESLIKLPIDNIFGDNETLRNYSNLTEYINYTSIVYHWDTEIELPKVWGFPQNEWGVGFIVLTDYMKFEEDLSKTVISMVITKFDTVSMETGKTAHESTEDELRIEVLRQSGFNISQEPISFIYPIKEEAYVRNINAELLTIPFQSNRISNAYNVGTHNKMSNYHFTSMESAVTNAIILSHELYPDTIELFNLSNSIEIIDIIHIIYIVLFLVLVGYKIT